MAEEKRWRHLNKVAARLSPIDAERFKVVVVSLQGRFSERDYHSAETYRLSTEFERLCAKSNFLAQRIEARSDGTPEEAVQPEGREPGPKDAPGSTPSPHIQVIDFERNPATHKRNPVSRFPPFG